MTEKFQLKRGGELTIQLVSQFYIAQVRQAARKKYLDEHYDGVEPEPPRHTVTLGGGNLPNGAPLPTWEEFYDYTEETIETASPADKAAWAEYIEARAALQDAENIAAWHVYGYRGVVDEPSEDDTWAERQREDGIEVPDKADKKAYKCHWLDTEVLVDQQEANWLVAMIRGQGDMVRQAQQASAAMFQRPLGQQGRQDDSGA